MALVAEAAPPAPGRVGSVHFVRYRVGGPHLWHERITVVAEPAGACLPGEAAAAWVLCPDLSSLYESVEDDTTDVAEIRPLPALGVDPAPPPVAHVNKFRAVPTADAVWTAIAEGVEATGWPCPASPFTLIVAIPGSMPEVINLAMPAAIQARLGPLVAGGEAVPGRASAGRDPAQVAALAAALGLPAPGGGGAPAAGSGAGAGDAVVPAAVGAGVGGGAAALEAALGGGDAGADVAPPLAPAPVALNEWIAEQFRVEAAVTRERRKAREERALRK